jgi:hypothetical protein
VGVTEVQSRVPLRAFYPWLVTAPTQVARERMVEFLLRRRMLCHERLTQLGREYAAPSVSWHGGSDDFKSGRPLRRLQINAPLLV